MDLRVGKNYQLIKKIGSGAFGEIYEGNLLFTFLIRHARQARHYEGDGRYQACKDYKFKDFYLVGTNQNLVPVARIWKQTV